MVAGLEDESKARLSRAGDLLHSITTLGLTDRSVDVGTNMRYARTVNDGGEITDPRTGRTRTVQAFPFAYLTPSEVHSLAKLRDLLKNSSSLGMSKGD